MKRCEFVSLMTKENAHLRKKQKMCSDLRAEKNAKKSTTDSLRYDKDSAALLCIPRNGCQQESGRYSDLRHSDAVSVTVMEVVPDLHRLPRLFY